MRRLFDGYSTEMLWVMTTRDALKAATSNDPLPSAERQIAIPQVHFNRRWIGTAVSLLNRLLIPWIIWRGVSLVRKEKIQALFTVPWDHFSIAAYFIHRVTRRPLYMYVMDDPLGNRSFGPFHAPLYKLLMPRIVRSSRRTWGVSDGMCEYLAQTYGVECSPLLPLVNVAEFRRRDTADNASDREFQLVYTGSIYSAQLDALRRLIKILSDNETGPMQMRLTIYTSLQEPVLKRMGLMGRNTRRDEVKTEDMPRVLAEADCAFLPLSFDPGMRHVVETSFPSKIAEYLAAGVPILVHAPSYSSVSRYCRKHNCGLVVDEPDETQLREALIRLRTDAALREDLSAKAVEVARKNHDANQIAAAFLQQMC